MANRKCLVCGKKYDFCPTCEKDRFEPFWKVSFHDDNCHDVWQTLCAVTCKTISEADGAKKLKKLDLTHVDSFAPVIRKQIKDLLGDTKKESFK